MQFPWMMVDMGDMRVPINQYWSLSDGFLGMMLFARAVDLQRNNKKIKEIDRRSTCTTDTCTVHVTL